MTHWLDFLATAVGAAFAFICLFDGARRMGTHGIHRTAVLMVGFGALFCIAYAGFSFWKSAALRDLTQMLQKTTYSGELPADWGNGLPPEQSEASSLALARMAFANTGTFPNYFDKKGRRTRFSPTEEDIKVRDLTVVTRARLEDSIRSSFEDALLWLIWGFVAAVFGFAVGREKRRLPANPTIDRDARESGARPSL